ncbi:MAG: hypothetical protein SGILL_006952 [Bacillariaceae sp.]
MHGTAVELEYGQRDRNKSFLFSVIRDPTAKAVSRFFHFAVSVHQQVPNFANFVNNMKSSSLARPHLRDLSTNPHYNWTKKTGPKPGQFILPKLDYHQVVQEILKDYDFIAITERMDESLVVMKMLLNLSLEEILYTKAARSAGSFSNGPEGRPCVYLTPSFLTPAMTEYLESSDWKTRIKGDELLYQAAYKSLDRTIDALGRPKVERTLAQFKKAQAHVQEKCEGQVRGIALLFGTAAGLVSVGKEQLTLRGAFIVSPPFATADQQGLLFDFLEQLKARAAIYGVDLHLDFTGPEGMTYNGALDYLLLDDDDPEQLDFVLGDYFITPERSQFLTFTPYFLATHMSTFRAPNGRFNSIQEANAGGGSVCVLKGTAMFDILNPIVNNIVACEPTFGGCVDDYLKQGTCDLVSDDVLYGLAAIQADEDVGLVATGENPVSDYAFYAFPLRSSLEPKTMQLLSRWIYQVVQNTNVMDQLSEKYFGVTTGAMEYVQPDSFSLTSAVMRQKPFAYQNEKGEWEGYFIDMAEQLQEIAKEDGVDFTIDIDFEDGVLSDTLTYDGSLNLLRDESYDMILGDYYMTSERSQQVTFAPSYLTSFITTFRHRVGFYDSLATMNAAGGVACLREGTAIFSAVSPLAANVKPCGPTNAECFTELKLGGCDLYAEDRVFGRLAMAEDEDIVANGDQLPADVFFNYGIPMSSALSPAAHVLMTKWTRAARTAGVFRELEKKWLMPKGVENNYDMHEEDHHDDEEPVNMEEEDDDIFLFGSSPASKTHASLFVAGCLSVMAMLV